MSQLEVGEAVGWYLVDSERSRSKLQAADRDRAIRQPVSTKAHPKRKPVDIDGHEPMLWQTQCYSRNSLQMAASY